jgi:co-chaperonin GroES (HSP10)
VKLNDLPADVLGKIAHMLKSQSNPNGIDADAVLPEPTGWHVLTLQYQRPEKTSGGIIFAEKTRKEDEYQGRVGVVLSLGPAAYAAERFGDHPWVAVGDLVAWPALENAAGRYAFGGCVLAVLPDDRLTLRGCDPAHMVGR